MELFKNQVVQWIPSGTFGRTRKTGTVRAIDSVARTVDLEFPDRSTRGAIPWDDIVTTPNPDLEAPPSQTEQIRPRGIESGEGFGRL